MKDIRDKIARPIGGNNYDNDDNDDNRNDNDDNGNNEIAETSSIDLSWMNDLQLY